MQTPRLVLARRLARSLRRGHPWVYADALRERPRLPPGTVCDLYDGEGRAARFVARGIYEPGSPLALRVYTTDPRERVDEALLARRLAAALRLRRELAGLDPATTDGYRLVNGEGDRLPGIVCDRYADTLVVRFDGDGPRALAPLLIRALGPLLPALGVARVWEREDDRAHAGPPPPERMEIRENGLRFGVDLRRGQKTGFFFDHRENRGRVRQSARGADVLNVFSYTGGFTVAAAAGGARSVVSVDSAAPALAECGRNLASNGLAGVPHEAVAGDAFEVLSRFAAERRMFDLVVLDPPSFAPSEQAVPRALAAYERLVGQGLAVLRPAGLLVFASCSSHVDEAHFLAAAREGAGAARRPLQALHVGGAGPDHPFPLEFPEGRYLKVLFAVAP